MPSYCYTTQMRQECDMPDTEKEEPENGALNKKVPADEENDSSLAVAAEGKEKGDRKNWYHVNRRLLPVKLIYFTFISGMGSLIPFIPLYMKQLGLTAIETGLLIGVMPFISFFVQPIFGAIADKTRKPKAVLIMCLICSGIFFGLLLLPGKFRGRPCKSTYRVLVRCTDNTLNVYSEQCVLSKNISHIRDENLDKLTNTDPFEDVCSISCASDTHEVVSVSTCSAENETDGIHTKVHEETSRSQILVNYKIQDSQDTETCQMFNLANSSVSDMNLTCKNNTYSSCSLECLSEDHETCHSANNNISFWIFACLYLCANIFFSPILSLIDAMAYNIFGDKRHLWGRQRLWGTLGFAIFSMTISVIRDIRKRETGTVDYSFSFYIYSSLCLVSAVVVTTLDVSDTFHCHKMLRNVTTLLRIPKVVGFFLVIMCLGIMQSLWLGFLFWYLEDLGSNQIIIGLVCFTTAFSEIAILSISGRIIRLIGHLPCLYISLLAYSVRHLSYSFLTNAWFVLPIELLHGVCLGLMYAAASAYASVISPEGTAATMQGLVAGLYFGFGRGLGFFLAGKLFDPIAGIGGRWTFRFFSLLSFVTFLVYATTNIVASKYSRKKRRHPQTDKKKYSDPAVPLQDEPFLDQKV